MTPSARARLQALAAGRGGRHTLAAPLALRLAARIQERPLDAFFTDPTQLANGVRDLVEAVAPDGAVVTSAEVLAEEIAARTADAAADGPRMACALEATRRLGQILGDRAVVVAVLPGAGVLPGVPDAPDRVLAVGRAFLEAGAGVVVVTERPGTDCAASEGQLRTLANVARFRRAFACLSGGSVGFLPEPALVALDAPSPSTGLVLTDTELPADVSVEALTRWVGAVRGG